MRFSRSQFFDSYREQFGQLNQQQVNGLERLLGCIENDPQIPEPPIGIYYVSDMLATVKRETADTFTPIHEYGGHNYFVQRYGGQTRKGRELGNDTPEEGALYAGRGDAQTTGETNYERAEAAIRREYPNVVADFERRTGRVFDLTVGDQPNDQRDPDNMLDPAISYATLSYGMRTGMWTGRKLSDYIVNGQPNYVGMRAIVNGQDHAGEIAGNARKFEKILKDSLISVAPVRLTDTDVDSLVGGIGAQTNSTPAAVSPFDNLAMSASSSQLPATNGQTDDGPEAQTAPPVDAQPPITQIAQTQTTSTDAGVQTTKTEFAAPAGEAPGILDHVNALGDKFQGLQGTLDKFGIANPIANTSFGTWFILIVKMAFGGVAMGFAFLKDNPIYLVLAGIAVVVVAWLYNESRKRVDGQRAGVPQETVDKIVDASLPVTK